MDDRRKKGEFVGALGALLVHVAVIALLILVSFTVPQPDEDAGGVPVMLGNVESARGFDDPSLVDVDILPEEPEAPAPAETQPELPSEQDLLTQTEEETVVLKPKTEPKKETVKPKEVVKPKEPVKKPEKTEAEKAAEAKRLAESSVEVQVFIDHDSCQRFGRSLLFALRQQHLYGIGRHHRRGNHKEYQQQEDDVRHGCHTEIGRYSISSF